MAQPFNVLLPSAGFGSRLKSASPKIGQLFIDKQRLYEKQIDVFNNICPDSEVFYVTGFLHDKVDSGIKNLGANVLRNDSFAHTNVSFSLTIGIKEIGTKNDILLVMGDLYFNHKLLKDFIIQATG